MEAAVVVVAAAVLDAAVVEAALVWATVETPVVADAANEIIRK